MSVSPRRYALWFTGTALVLLAITWVVVGLLRVPLPLAALPAFPAMVAAMVEGARHAKGTRDPLPTPWRSAGILTGTALAIVLFLAAPMIYGLATDGGALRTLAIVGVVYIVVWYGVNRLFLTLGARNEWATQDRAQG